MTFLHFNQWYANETFKTSTLDDSCNNGPQEIRGFICQVIYQTSILLLPHNISVIFTPQQSPVIFQYKKHRTNHAKYMIQLNLLRTVICGTNQNHYAYFSYLLVTQTGVTVTSIRTLFCAGITDSPTHRLSRSITSLLRTQAQSIVLLANRGLTDHIWHIQHTPFRPYNFPFLTLNSRPEIPSTRQYFPSFDYIKTVPNKDHTDFRFRTIHCKHNHSHKGLFGHKTTNP